MENVISDSERSSLLEGVPDLGVHDFFKVIVTSRDDSGVHTSHLAVDKLEVAETVEIKHRFLIRYYRNNNSAGYPPALDR